MYICILIPVIITHVFHSSSCPVDLMSFSLFGLDQGAGASAV